jgi:hypothetical protein
MEKMYIDDRNDEQDYIDVDKYTKMCKFNNCNHQNEPGCAVITAIHNGELTEDKLKRYFKLLRANEFLNNKSRYNHEWNRFTVNLSKSSKKSNSNNKSEFELLEQETAQIQEESYMNMEEEN